MCMTWDFVTKSFIFNIVFVCLPLQSPDVELQIFPAHSSGHSRVHDAATS